MGRGGTQRDGTGWNVTGLNWTGRAGTGRDGKEWNGDGAEWDGTERNEMEQSGR